MKSNAQVNVANYRTPLKLRDIMRKLIQDLADAGIIEPCENNQFNSPCMLVDKKTDANEKGGEKKTRTTAEDMEGLQPGNRLQETELSHPGCGFSNATDSGHCQRLQGMRGVQHHGHSPRLLHNRAGQGEQENDGIQLRVGKMAIQVSATRIENQPSSLPRTNQQRPRWTVPRVHPYIDDILAGDKKAKPDHVNTLRGTFSRLRRAGYKLKLGKCVLMRKRVPFLGSEVSAAGVAISEEKKNGAQNLSHRKHCQKLRACSDSPAF